MGKLEPASDPSMEDILASIRRIIADDDGPRKPPVAPPHLSVVERTMAAGPIIREPAAPLAADPVRFDATPHALAEPRPRTPVIAPPQARAVLDGVAVATSGSAPVVAPATAAPAPVERPAVAVIAPVAPAAVAPIAQQAAAPVVARVEHAVSAAPMPPPAFPQRGVPLSPAAIEREVARLLASPRPPNMASRPTPPPQPVTAHATSAPAPATPAPAPAAIAPAPVTMAPAPAPQATQPAPAPVAPPVMAHSPAPEPVATVPPASAVAMSGHPAATAAKAGQGLLSPNSDAAVRTAFDQLADTMFSREARSLEDVVKDMMRPMLRDWLDDNLPPLVERLVREEIQRVSRGRK